MRRYRSATAERRIAETYTELLAQWNVDARQLDIPTHYGMTHVITCGEAQRPPLVLFHGVGDDSALMWVYNAEALSRHFRLYAVDTIGGPGKTEPNATYGHDFDDVRWIDDVFDGLQLDAARIAGTSNGAYLAQRYGAHRPERTPRIVCLAGTVPAGTGNTMQTMMRIFLPEAAFPTRRNVLRLMRKLSGDNARALTENPTLMEHYRWLLKGFSPMSMRFHRVEALTDEQIDGLRPRTLYIVGDRDPFMRLGGAAQLTRYGMNVRVLPGAGHGINHEAAREVERLMIEFLLAER